jgi:hypothetical protein
MAPGTTTTLHPPPPSPASSDVEDSPKAAARQLSHGDPSGRGGASARFSLLVTGLRPDMTEERVLDVFTRMGPVSAVRLVQRRGAMGGAMLVGKEEVGGALYAYVDYFHREDGMV